MILQLSLGGSTGVALVQTYLQESEKYMQTCVYAFGSLICVNNSMKKKDVHTLRKCKTLNLFLIRDIVTNIAMLNNKNG
jgi:hypothetical protein